MYYLSDFRNHMKKAITILFIAGIFNTWSQNNAGQRTCGTPVLPDQYEDWINALQPVKGKYGTASIQSVFNIPVIVHILHNNESVNSISATSGNNINAAQVADQIAILNRDYNGLNPDTSLIPAVFRPLRGKFQVNFCLAVVNPTGGVLAEPGIDRINRVAKGWTAFPYSSTYMDATVKPNSIWDPNKYLNIWIAPLSSGLLGYATFPNPGTSGLSGLSAPFGTTTSDGVVISNTAFGSIGTGQGGVYNKGRTTTHEVGHWMGLRHIWGDSNCGTDYCNDTPPAQAANYGCPGFPLRLGTCSGNTTGEMTMNFMDYTNDACMYMFTADQKNRAQLILANSPMRRALITSTACNLPAITDDIGISYVAYPTYSQSLNCVNAISPVVNVTNYGTTTLTTALFSFNVDGVNTQTFSWSGSAAPNTSFTLALPQIGGLGFGAHVFSVNVSAPNGGTDNNLSNNNNLQHFSIVNNFAFTVSSGAVCQGSSIVLTANGASSYSWSTGATTSTVSVSPTVTTVYTVTAFSGLCAVPRTTTITVQSPPALTINKTTVCENMPVSITASGANSYTWSSGETSASINVTLAASTNYTVTGSTSAGCLNSQVFSISVSQPPAIAAADAFVSCGSCNDATLTVSVTGGTAPYTYLWMPGNITTVDAPGLGVGCYTVTVTDAKGCGIMDTACVSFETGLFGRKLSGEKRVKVSPNPGGGKYSFEFPVEGKKSLEVIDALGKRVFYAETNAAAETIDISSYPKGMYYARVVSGEGLNTVLKLVKE